MILIVNKALLTLKVPLNRQSQKYVLYHTIISSWDRDQIGIKLGTKYVKS